MVTQGTFCGIVPAVNQNLRAYGMVSLWFFLMRHDANYNFLFDICTYFHV